MEKRSLQKQDSCAIAVKAFPAVSDYSGEERNHSVHNKEHCFSCFRKWAWLCILAGVFSSCSDLRQFADHINTPYVPGEDTPAIHFFLDSTTEYTAVSCDSNGLIASLPADPTRKGYTFAGWWTALEGGGEEFTVASIVKDSTTVYAKWIINQYTVTFLSSDGTLVYSTIAVDYGSPVGTLPTTPKKTGCYFAGWRLTASISSLEFLATTIVTEAVSVYATWSDRPTYTVTYSADDGATVYSSEIVFEGKTVSALPEDPLNDGYTFTGWWTAINGGGSQFLASTVVTADIEVFANWVSLPRCTVSYYLDVGVSLYTSTEIIIGRSVASLPSDPVRQGYSFAGWWTLADGSGGQFLTTTTVSAAIAVYAKWTTVSYGITYSLNGGSNNEANPSAYTIESATISLLAPSRSGYAFAGWYSDSDFAAPNSTIPMGSAGDRIFYARWLAGNTLFAAVSIPGDGTLSFLPENPTVVKGVSLTVSVSQSSYAYYVWYLDNTKQAESSSSITIPTASLVAGVHRLMLAVTDSIGLVSSGSVVFTVTN